MNINPISNISNYNLNFKNNTKKNVQDAEVCPDDNKLVKELDKMSMINNVNIGKKDYIASRSRQTYSG